MGWKSISKTGEIRYEGHENPELGGRPVQQGEEGNLVCIIQEDYGHTIVVDLIGGAIGIDPETYEFQNGRFYIHNAKTLLFLADETSIVGEMAHVEQKFDLKRDKKGRKIHDENGKLVEVRTDILTPLVMRPIWFTRHINSAMSTIVKVIGLQTTLPEIQGGQNVKLMLSLYPDGRIGISG